MSRLTALGAVVAVGLLLAAPAGGALEASISIEPARPAALEPVAVTLRSYVPVLRSDGTCCRLEPGGSRSYPFRVEAVSPAGRVMRVRMRPGQPNLRRGTVTFPAAGRWTLRVANYEQRGYRRAFGSRPSIVVRVTAPKPTPAPAGFASLGRAGCAPASPAGQKLGQRTVFGTALGGEQLWAMPVLPGEGSRWARLDRAEFEGLAGKEMKIVFAMTSYRTPFVATGPEGVTVQPVWRQGHVGPTWVGIPGYQWGAGFVFPEPGCWKISVGARGAVYLLVRS